MKYIDADLLRNEIERLKIKACGSQATEEEIVTALSSLDLVIRFIDTLLEQPVITKSNALFDKCVENCDPAVMKEVSDNIDKMLASEGLEEEVRKYLSERWKLGCTPITPVCLPNFTTDDLKECADFFYKLGLISKK